jgi:hypothetical protein
MTTILAVDPGLRGCGVACFDQAPTIYGSTEMLVWAKYVRNPVREGDSAAAIAAMAREVGRHSIFEPVDLLAVEFPQVYQGSKAKGDPRDLLTLAAIDGGILLSVSHREARRYFPREWKGQVDGDVMLDRILARLSPSEVGRIERCPESLRHNVIDAIGIGLFAAGRLAAHKVIARGG